MAAQNIARTLVATLAGPKDNGKTHYSHKAYSSVVHVAKLGVGGDKHGGRITNQLHSSTDSMAEPTAVALDTII
jgi:hypothetical protein